MRAVRHPSARAEAFQIFFFHISLFRNRRISAARLFDHSKLTRLDPAPFSATPQSSFNSARQSSFVAFVAFGGVPQSSVDWGIPPKRYAPIIWQKETLFSWCRLG